MAVSYVPVIMAALVTQATAALPAVTVSYGWRDTEDNPGDWLMIGVPDPFGSDAANVSTSTQVMATAGTPRSRDENVSIPCHAYSANGDRDQQAALEAAMATFEAAAALVRVTPDLGISHSQKLILQVSDVNIYLSDTGEAGAEALVVFTVAADTRI
jgi:hypothetical protein